MLGAIYSYIVEELKQSGFNSETAAMMTQKHLPELDLEKLRRKNIKVYKAIVFRERKILKLNKEADFPKCYLQK